MSAQTNQTVTNGTYTTAISFPGTNCLYNWVNNNPSIGLPASGTGNIQPFTAINNSNNPITATLTANPIAVNYSYIANYNSNTVTVINTIDNSVVKTISVGQNPISIAVKPDNSTIYVGNVTSKSVTVISSATNTVVNTINLPISANYLTINKDGDRLYVTNDTNLAVVDLLTNKIISNTYISLYLNFSAISPDGKLLYISTSNNNVQAINTATNTVIAKIGPKSSTAITVSADGSLIYIGDSSYSNPFSAALYVINAADYSQSGKYSLAGPYNFALSKDGKVLYIASIYGTIFSMKTVGPPTFVPVLTNVISSGASLSITPDGQKLFITQASVGNILALDLTKPDPPVPVAVGLSPISWGNFIAGGVGCITTPITVKITVNPTPIISFAPVNGTISTCESFSSAYPYIQTFTVSGSRLSDDILATAPAGFEVSLNPYAGYGAKVLLSQSAGMVNNANIYVRSSAAASAGNISGDVLLSSAGVVFQKVAVNGFVNIPPVVISLMDQTVTDDGITTDIKFSGTAEIFYWTNDNPNIGLPLKGVGDIAAFKAVNKGVNQQLANILVTPFNSKTNCAGNPVSFKITVNPPLPSINATSNILTMNTIYGTPCASVSFMVSGDYMADGILITSPTNFEISLDDKAFNNTLFINVKSGNVQQTVVFVRLKATAAAASYNGTILLKSLGATDRYVTISNSVVNRADLKITADNADVTYGSALSPIIGSAAFTTTGLKNNENIGLVNIAYQVGNKIGANAGYYPGSIIASLARAGYFNPNNYNVTYLPGNLTINPAMLTVIAEDKTKFLGSVNPPFTITYNGFISGDAPQNLITQPTAFSTADKNSPVGKYSIVPANGVSSNYNFIYISGTLVVNPNFGMLVIPNAFTPNNDGINDTWHIANLNLYGQCVVAVLNRYGQEIYHSISYMSDWDGKYKGADLPTGTYYYMIKEPNSGKTISGKVTLIR